MKKLFSITSSWDFFGSVVKRCGERRLWRRILSSILCGKQWLWYAEDFREHWTLMKFKNITYHKGDKWSILSFVGSLNGGHLKKRYFSQGSRWRRPCQDISQIWPRIRGIHEHMRCHLAIQKELCQNLWQLEVSETRVAFVSSTPSSDLSHRRNSMSVYLTSYHHLFMAHSIKGLMHKSPRGLALS